MVLPIDRDLGRFRRIVRGAVRKNLRRFMSKGELLGKKGKDLVSIPLPQIDIPRFRLDPKGRGGVAQGDGEVGDPIGRGDGGQGKGQAGDTPGEHVLEVDITLDELAEIMGEELGLPNIKPRGRKTIQVASHTYKGIRRVGPESLRHFKRTFKEALKRQIASGTYDPDNPVVIPFREDRRYRSWKTQTIPQTNAVIIYMMDVSGSMGEEQKEIVRVESFWIDTWLRHQYQGIESRYIIHDATAREVDRETFFHTRESGGTMISSAYRLCKEIIETDYPEDDWNVYPFHFSDGDNWSMDDTSRCIALLKDFLIPRSNVFCYGQVESPYGSGQFIKDLREHFDPEQDDIIFSEIKNRDAIYDSIKDFLGKGK